MKEDTKNAGTGCSILLLLMTQVGLFLLYSTGFLADWQAWKVLLPTILLGLLVMLTAGYLVTQGMVEALNKTEKN